MILTVRDFKTAENPWDFVSRREIWQLQYLAIRQYATSKCDVKQTVLPYIDVTITAKK